MKKHCLLAGILCGVSIGVSAAEITIEKPYFRWLFNGFGFQHPEANLEALMSDEFRDQRAVKSFLEISPSFGRVYAAYDGISKAQLDRFADYYDKTFRKAGTTLYVCPGRMPGTPESFDADEYAERMAKNLEYLMKDRQCNKFRYYCLSNELMAGDTWEYFNVADPARSELYRKFNIALFNAFRRHGLDLLLLGTDEAATSKPYKVMPFLQWTIQNLGDWMGSYCTHWYVYGRTPDDLTLWHDANQYFAALVDVANKASNKRYILGEWGFSPAYRNESVPMWDDTGYHARLPEKRTESVLQKCEVGLAAMNQGAAACVSWSFVDYPDPFIIENGDSAEEKAVYDAGLSGYHMDRKYNKWGMFKWESTDRDYSSYEELYALGWMAKLFKKSATVLRMSFGDDKLRGGAILNPDLSVTIAVVNRGEARELEIDCSSWKTRRDGTPSFHQPFRRIVYDSAAVPVNEFNDLQKYTDTVSAREGMIALKLPARSMTFLTTDYQDVKPGKIRQITLADGRLSWSPAESRDHVYYRVYHDGKQIASTVATTLAVKDGSGTYAVTGVDRWNNEGDR